MRDKKLKTSEVLLTFVLLETLWNIFIPQIHQLQPYSKTFSIISDISKLYAYNQKFAVPEAVKTTKLTIVYFNINVLTVNKATGWAVVSVKYENKSYATELTSYTKWKNTRIKFNPSSIGNKPKIRTSNS